jgi:hypothetical protein
MINIESFKKLREAIASAAPEKCNMQIWEEDCGCFGHFAEVAGGIDPHTTVVNPARRFLGIADDDHASMYDLFLDFPQDVPEEGWQRWMLNRVDMIIRAGRVTNWRNG